MLQRQSMQCNYATIMITALPLQSKYWQITNFWRINCLFDDLSIAATLPLFCAGIMVDNTYHAGTVRDVAAMNAASSTGYTMTNAATNASADSQLTVHDFLSGMAQLRDVLDNTNDGNSAVSSDTVCL